MHLPDLPPPAHAIVFPTWLSAGLGGRIDDDAGMTTKTSEATDRHGRYTLGIVDNDPLVQKPRLYAPHFVDKLEKCDALEWRKAWFTTEIGKQGLEMLADVVDESATDSKED